MWSSSSWKSKPVAQDIHYPDRAHLDRVLKKIKTLPPLVTPSEVERLRSQITLVQQGQAFLLHAGDCAESFDACTHENISAKIGLILSFSLILIWGARVPVVRIGRIAGQYAKPRSSPTENIGGREILSFRGDNINGLNPDERTPDPERLLSAYFHSATTLNHIRALLASGFASLRKLHPRSWSLSHVRSASLRAEFERIVDSICDGLDFSQTIGLDSGKVSYEKGGGKTALGEVDFYTSHEGLMLEYEEALTRRFPIPESVLSSSEEMDAPQHQETYYNTSAHFVWIGDRTRQLDGGHVEYFRGIRNPIGIKVGPSMGVEEIVKLLDIVNPGKENGRVTLITRYGTQKIEGCLPRHIEAVGKSGHPVAWICDPMHGNTQTSASGLKTRRFSNIISELTSAVQIHAACGSRLGGVSLEFTGEVDEDGFSVTECLGGSMGLSEEELGLRYESFCDPRLNFEQSLDIAFHISNHLKRGRREHKDEGGHDVVYSELGGHTIGARSLLP